MTVAVDLTGRQELLAAVEDRVTFERTCRGPLDDPAGRHADVHELRFRSVRGEIDAVHITNDEVSHRPVLARSRMAGPSATGAATPRSTRSPSAGTESTRSRRDVRGSGRRARATVGPPTCRPTARCSTCRAGPGASSATARGGYRLPPSKTRSRARLPAASSPSRPATTRSDSASTETSKCGRVRGADPHRSRCRRSRWVGRDARGPRGAPRRDGRDRAGPDRCGERGHGR